MTTRTNGAKVAQHNGLSRSTLELIAQILPSLTVGHPVGSSEFEEAVARIELAKREVTAALNAD